MKDNEQRAIDAMFRLLEKIVPDLKDPDTNTDDAPPEVKRFMNALSEVNDITKQFSRFPKDLHDALKTAVKTETAIGEALLVACSWVSTLDERLDKTEESHKHFEHRANATDRQLAKLHEIVKGLEAHISAQNKHIVDLQSRADMQYGNMQEVTKSMKSLSHKQGNMVAQLNGQRDHMTRIGKDIKRLENAPKTRRSDNL